MSSTGPDAFGPDHTGRSPEQPDPAAALAAAMRELWGLSGAILHASAARADPGRAGREEAFRTMSAPAARMLAAYAELMARLAGGRIDPPDDAPGGARAAVELAPALVEAASVAMGSAVRYGEGLAEVFARHQSTLANAAAARSSDETGPSDRFNAETEDLRVFLRDVSETAMLEARRLAHELDQLSEAVAQAAASSSPDDAYKRRWAAKP